MSLTDIHVHDSLVSKSFTVPVTYQKPEPGSACPMCERRVPHPRDDHAPRKRSQLLISVPKDAEDGEAILRHLIELARDKVGRPEGTPPYFVLVEALYAYLT